MIRRPTIVLVDDSPEVRALVRTQLSRSGRIEVLAEGGDGLDAVALAGQHRPDLMLLDVSMPRMDGLAALPLVLERSPTTRVVMYSGFEESGLASETRALGASAFLEKSVPAEVLVDTLLAVSGPPGTASPDPARPGAELDPTLEDHLERFREVFEDAAIGMGTMTLAGRLVRANHSLSALFGVAEADLVGVSLAELAGADVAVEEALVRLRDGEPVVQVEHRAHAGGTRHFRSTLSPVLDAKGRPLYLFLQVQDVTRQVTTEAELRRTEARFRLLVEAVQDYAIFMLDPDGLIASWNIGAQRANGYTAEEAIGRHFRMFYPEDVAASGHPEHELELALRDGKYEEEGWRIRKDGSRFWATVTITAVRDPDGELVGFAKVTRDNTERREMLQRLARAAEEQAEFFAVTAHELRSPITVLSGSAQLLAQHDADLDPDERSGILDSMQRSAEQLRRLLVDLLTAARLQAHRLELQPTSVDLGAHVRQAVAALRPSVGDAELGVEVADGLWVLADPVRLTQILDNLVLNAVRHGRPPVLITATTRGDLVELCVRDAGAGVEEHLQSRLFERFATGSSQGTGLGLFLVRELARAHGGDAAYRVEDGAFTVTLPRGEPA